MRSYSLAEHAAIGELREVVGILRESAVMSEVIANIIRGERPPAAGQPEGHRELRHSLEHRGTRRLQPSTGPFLTTMAGSPIL